MGQRPAGQQTTKSLNTGATITVNPIIVEGVILYMTPDNGSPAGPYYAVFGLDPMGPGFNTVTQVPIPAFGQAPATNTAGIPSPTVAIFAQTIPAGGPPLPAGTYQLAYTFLTNLGQTTHSPPTAITVDGTEWIQVNNGDTTPFTAATAGATVELIVPNLEDWHVTRYAVFVSTSVHVPSINLYIDTQSITSLLDTSALGAQNSANADLYLRPGQRMIAVWVGADPFAQCTLSVYGEKTS
jgi:hypothetical protein